MSDDVKAPELDHVKQAVASPDALHPTWEQELTERQETPATEWVRTPAGTSHRH